MRPLQGSALDRLLRFQDYDPAPAEMATATEADGAWEVEALEERRVRNGKVEYLVWAGEGWEGWPPETESKRTWETEGRIHADLVAAYDQAAPALPPQVKRRKRKRAPARHSVSTIFPLWSRLGGGKAQCAHGVRVNAVQAARAFWCVPRLRPFVPRPVPPSSF